MTTTSACAGKRSSLAMRLTGGDMARLLRADKAVQHCGRAVRGSSAGRGPPLCSDCAAAQEHLHGDPHRLVDALAPCGARRAGEPAELMLADQHVEEQH